MSRRPASVTQAEPVARTVKDFCRAYGIGKSLAYELMAAGTLSAVKAGTRTLILEESAKAWFGKLPRTHAASHTPAPTHVLSGDTGGNERKRAEAKIGDTRTKSMA